MNEFDTERKFNDLSEMLYKNSLAVVSVIELLIEKGVISRRDIIKKSQFLDSLTPEQLRLLKSQDK